jgi:hypothetical protein
MAQDLAGGTRSGRCHGSTSQVLCMKRLGMAVGRESRSAQGRFFQALYAHEAAAPVYWLT